MLIYSYGCGTGKRSFPSKNQNGRLFGRGACDTKGSIASFFHAFLQLSKEKNRPKNTEIIFVGLIDEEYGQAGSSAAKEAQRQTLL